MLMLDRSVTETAQLTCRHCGLKFEGKVAHASSTEDAFCCSGCRGAYELIHGWGLDNYYSLRDQLTAKGGQTVGDGPSDFASFDDDAFLGRSKPMDVFR